MFAIVLRESSRRLDVYGDGVKHGHMGAVCRTMTAMDLQRCFRWSGVTRELACHETGHTVGLTHGDWAWPIVSNGDPRLSYMRTPRGGVAVLGLYNSAAINNAY